MDRRIVVLLLATLPSSAFGATLQGTVADSKDRPIVGARVGIATAAPRKGQAIFCPSCYLDCAKSVRTDSKGRFQIPNVSDALKFQVLVTAPKQKTYSTKLFDPASGELDVHLEPVSAVEHPERLVRGRIVDNAGRAVEGALVDPCGAKQGERRWHGAVNVSPAVSDEEGRFSMLLPNGMEGVDLEVTVNGKAGALVDLLAAGGDERTITLPTGTRVTGRLAHEGKPVANLGLAVVQIDRSAGQLFIKAVASTTDRDGRFDFNYLPANQKYAIYTLVGYGAAGDRKEVLSTKTFTARDNNVTRDLGTLEVQPAVYIHGRVELPEGVRLPADAKLSLSRDPAWDLISIPIAADGTFAADGLPPETYELAISVKGIEVDGSRVKHHLTEPQAIAVHVSKSMDELVIPAVLK